MHALPVVDPVGFFAHGKSDANVNGAFEFLDEAEDDVGEALFFCFPDERMDGADGIAATGFVFWGLAIFAPEGFGGVFFGDFYALRGAHFVPS